MSVKSLDSDGLTRNTLIKSSSGANDEGTEKSCHFGHCEVQESRVAR